MTRAIRVLQSFPEPLPTTNPYVILLRDHLAASPDVSVRTFSWRRALLGRYDVLHLHWPDTLVGGRSPARAALRRLLFLALLLRLRLTSAALVRTLHNLRPHESTTRTVRWLLALTDRWTAVFVRLNDATPVRPGAVAVTIPHGHYRPWYDAYPAEVADPARLAFVGFVRPYKNVEELIRAFRACAPAAGHAPTLEVAGQPADPGLADRLRAAASGDERIALRLGHLDDADLVHTVRSAALVVLPYREMHNSGAALMALSLDRPVLVPDNVVNRDLAAEVGEEWVRRYSPPLRPDDLLAGLDRARTLPPHARPRLDERDWPEAAAAHVSAYRRALPRRRRARVSATG